MTGTDGELRGNFSTRHRRHILHRSTPIPSHRRVELDANVTTGGGLMGPPNNWSAGSVQSIDPRPGSCESVYAYYRGRAEVITQPADRPRRSGGFKVTHRPDSLLLVIKIIINTNELLTGVPYYNTFYCILFVFTVCPSWLKSNSLNARKKLPYKFKVKNN